MMREGGVSVYVPPAMKKKKAATEELYDERKAWEALRKSLVGLMNKVNSANIKNIVPELLSENLVRGRGLFCRSCINSQAAFPDVFAAVAAVVNSKFPEIGHLLVRRLVLHLRSAYKRNDKRRLAAAAKFAAHLVNQQVAGELLALEMLTLLLENPTEDGVEVAVGFVTECGSHLQEVSPRALDAVFDRFRGILHEGEIDKRVQFLIEGLFALRKAKRLPGLSPELDLVEEEDIVTHQVSLLDDINGEYELDVFRHDPEFEANEERYQQLKKRMLEESESESEEDADEDGESESEESESESEMKIRDESGTDLVNLRRSIYLTIMSCVDFEEAGHKLMKMNIIGNHEMEMEVCVMLLECCRQERTYLRYYALLAQRLCAFNTAVFRLNFETCFARHYAAAHRMETNSLRNIAYFFAHLFTTDALSWDLLACIRLTEDDTTSSSRIFLKFLFQQMSHHVGIPHLNDRIHDFSDDTPRNVRFVINFFTSIGLGGITEKLRSHLRHLQSTSTSTAKTETKKRRICT